MIRQIEGLRPRARAALFLFLAVVASAACVHHPVAGWNVNTRLNLVFAIVDMGTFSIDAYHDLEPYATNDKAFYDGRFYCDKIIGVSLLGLPVYAALRGAGSLVGWFPDYHVAHYAMRLVAVSVPAGIALVLLWKLMLLCGAEPRRALLACAFTFWGSMHFGYATLFMPYAPAICLAQGALLLCVAPGRFTLARAGWCGFLCGASLLQELLFGPVVLLVGVAFIARCLRRDEAITWPGVAARVGVGAIAGALPLLLFVAYSIHIFDKPVIPYEYEHDEGMRRSMQHGIMGIERPNPTTLWFLTVHPFRGLFFWTPVMLCAFAGAAMLAREKGDRLLGWLALASGVIYLYITMSYYMWWGGWAMGSRHLLPAFAMLPVGLAALCRDQSRVGWWLVVVLGAVGVVLSLPVALVDPQVPTGTNLQNIFALRVGDNPPITQFHFWRAFMSLQFFRDAEKGLRVGLLAGRMGAIVLPALFLALAWRALPRPARGDGGQR